MPVAGDTEKDETPSRSPRDEPWEDKLGAGLLAVFVAAAVIAAIASVIGDWSEPWSTYIRILGASAAAGTAGGSYGFHLLVWWRQRGESPHSEDERSILEHEMKALGPIIGFGIGVAAALLTWAIPP